MIDPASIKAIEARKREIDEQIKGLTKESDELDVALRVLHRFNPTKAANGGVPKLGPPRPTNTPTLFVMTTTVINDAVKAGKQGLTAKEIVEAIGRRFWPGVKTDQIQPSVYRFLNRGRLRKTDGLFQVISLKEKGPEQGSEPSLLRSLGG